MEILSVTGIHAEIKLTVEELKTINNALNEVCHGIEVFEFETRMGVSRERTTAILESFGKLIDEVEKKK